MDERYSNSIEKSKGAPKERKNLNPFKAKLLTLLLAWVTFTSCDTIENKRNNLWWIDPEEKELKEQIRREERIINNERDLAHIQRKLNIRIEQRKEKVETYIRLLEECKEDPKNIAKKKSAQYACKVVGEYNREIKSLEAKKNKKTQKLDDERSESRWELPTWNVYTDPNYFDYLKKNEKDDTANFLDYVENEDPKTEYVENDF